jgi:alkanesulfonate monooxygenase SsuD/methylene tetrahydromethanopterin reductase-like flavin-dependent oxidoreductase (luciferase family)
MRIAAKWADAWNTWGAPDVLLRKNAVLDAHCEALGRDPAEISRSAQAIIKPDDPAVVMEAHPTSPAVLSGSAEQLRDHIGQYAQTGIDEFIVPDWNTGRGQARRDFFDWFADEIATTCR